MTGLRIGTWLTNNKEMVKSALWIIGFLALIAFMQNKDASANAQTAYVKALETIVINCTNSGDNIITIDNEVYMCGAVSTGIKLNTK